MGIPDHLTCLLRNQYAGKKQQLEPDMEKQTGSKSGKEYVKAICCHPAYLTYMQSSVQFSSVAQSCPTLCNRMNHSTPGLPVHHQLLEFTQTHVHRVSDAIQPSPPPSSPSPLAFNFSQHQGLLFIYLFLILFYLTLQYCIGLGDDSEGLLI